MKITQLQKIRNQLLTNGEVSRNWCLSWYCTRLGARIIDLKKEGFKFEIEHSGGDYVYKLVKDTPQAITSPKIDATACLEPKVAPKQDNLFKLRPIRY